MHLNLYDHKDPKWRAFEHLMPKPPSTVEPPEDKEDLVIASFEFEDVIPPVTPLANVGHFAPDHRLSQDMRVPDPEFGPEMSSAGDQELDFFQDAEDPAMDMFFPDNDNEDTEMQDVPDADAMLHSLLSVGTDPHAAKLVINKMHGSIVADANRKRRFLSIDGLNAFGPRTKKPEGQHWNFNVRADRQLSRRMISERGPEWIIGSPPCTAFCNWRLVSSTNTRCQLKRCAKPLQKEKDP